MQTANMHLSARTVWGKIVLFLKEQRQIALHVACGDVTDVEIVGDELKINLEDGMLVDILQEGQKEIERALRWQGLDLKVKFNLKIKIKTDMEKDIDKLKNIFGNKLKIK